VIDRIDNVTMITMSSVGFGLSPASGHAVRDLVIDGKCAFTDLEKLSLKRFEGLDKDWRAQKGWVSQSETI
jgi:sarcosine oxidase subunit beta